MAIKNNLIRKSAKIQITKMKLQNHLPGDKEKLGFG